MLGFPTSTGVSKNFLFSTYTDDLSFKQPIIFPNPTSDKLFIAENDRSQIDEITVYDSFGNVALKEKIISQILVYLHFLLEFII